jgi:hypothetical protein
MGARHEHEVRKRQQAASAGQQRDQNGDQDDDQDRALLDRLADRWGLPQDGGQRCPR